MAGVCGRALSRPHANFKGRTDISAFESDASADVGGLTERIAHGEFDTLIAWHPDRLTAIPSSSRRSSTYSSQPLSTKAEPDIGGVSVNALAPIFGWMSHVIVDVDSISPGRGSHPAASPYDKRISDALGVTAFAVYQVELPAGAETVRHDHLDDRNEDVYAIISGHGWVVVDGEPFPVAPGHFVSVDLGSTRFLRAGDAGLTLIAVCASSMVE